MATITVRTPKFHSESGSYSVFFERDGGLYEPEDLNAAERALGSGFGYQATLGGPATAHTMLISFPRESGFGAVARVAAALKRRHSDLRFETSYPEFEQILAAI